MLAQLIKEQRLFNEFNNQRTKKKKSLTIKEKLERESCFVVSEILL
jgi:hypothetical protein